MKSIIQKLWYGNIIPQDALSNTKEMKTLLGTMAEHYANLEKNMTEDQKDIFEKFQESWNQYASLSEEIVFEYAFKLGMKLAVEGLTE